MKHPAALRNIGFRLDHESAPGGPNTTSAAGRNNTLHKTEDTIVAVIKNANLLKNFRMHSHSILPEMMVVMAEENMLLLADVDAPRRRSGTYAGARRLARMERPQGWWMCGGHAGM